MSLFDPYNLYTPTRKRATIDGQIIRKRFGKPNFALTKADLDKAKQVMDNLTINCCSFASRSV